MKNMKKKDDFYIISKHKNDLFGVIYIKNAFLETVEKVTKIKI